MNRIIPAFLIILLNHFSFAQNSSLITIKNDSSLIYLERLEVEVEVVGNIATTVAEMTFYNPNDRVLEGELNFPLTEGQSVYRFAMDVNGKLREGVSVEKNEGRKAFEGVVRQAIDPGLLEMTVGNNYKARVYPIPANGRKKVVVGYEEELKNGAMPLYQLVMDYGTVSEFNLKVKVVNQNEVPVIKKNELANFSFTRWESSYLAEVNKKDFNANGVLSFEIPVEMNEKIYLERTQEEDYFYLTFIPEVLSTQRELPSNLGIIWDASKSGEKRALDKELSFLAKYLEQYENLNVTILRFSNEIIDQSDFEILKGNSDHLIEYLKNTNYDGGTNLSCLDLSVLKAQELLLFSDGISNLSSSTIQSTGSTIHVISTSTIADIGLLKYYAEKSGGAFVNLLNTSTENAIDALLNLNYQFISASCNEKKIHEIYPNQPMTVVRDAPFSMAGMINSKKAVSVTVNFGIGGEILQSKKLLIDPKGENGSVSRLWANKKLSELAKQKELNKDEIISLGKDFRLVTPYTSLIVLDRVEDYVRYKIEPPLELIVEYNRMIEEELASSRSQAKDILSLALEEYEDRVEWWKNDFHDTAIFMPKKKDEAINNQNDSPVENSGQNDDETEPNQIDEEPQLDSSLLLNQSDLDTAVFNKLIHGVIKGQFGEGIPGVSILIKGTELGTITDLDGRYALRIRKDDTIVVSFIGYVEEEVVVGDSSTVDLSLTEDVQQLSEVVVTGFATHEQRSLSSSVTQISNQLQGRAAGVRILPSVGENNMVVTRGSSSVNIGSQPLYVIDGVVSDDTDFNALSPEEVASMNVIQGENAESIYGTRASDGVIVIMTKSALEDEIELPDSITSKFVQDVEIREWEPLVPYLDSLKKEPKATRYMKYMALKDKYGSAPSFYLVTGDFFIRENDGIIGIRILSNITELELENHEMLKILAQRYQQLGEYEESIYLFKKILELRGDEPQSKRDLALVYQASGEYQKALNLFGEILLNDIEDEEERFPLFKSTVLHEMNNLISLYNKELDVSAIPKSLIIDMPVDVRIVLNWNALETDLDLWVTEPNGEKCYYENDLTKIGGRLTEDYVDGYGPEEYLLKKAIPGQYKIEVDYYDERIQKISGPVTLQVSIFTNYGSVNQKVKELTLQLEGEEDIVEVGTFNWE